MNFLHKAKTTPAHSPYTEAYPLMPPRLSVVLCSPKPRPNYFHRVFDALRQQTFPLGKLELLVVDKQSHAPAVTSTTLTSHAQTRVSREETPSLTRARRHGFAKGSSSLFIYLNDDNVRDSVYRATAVRFAETMPFLGLPLTRLNRERLSARQRLLQRLHIPPVRTMLREWGNRGSSAKPAAQIRGD